MNRPTQSGFRFRFGIGTLLLVMVVVSVTAAAASYMVRGNQQEGWGRLVFILFTLAAPVMLLVVISVLHVVLSWLNRR